MNFLYGTYGFDILSLFLLLLGTLFNSFYYTRLIGLFLLIIILFRAFSKNTYKRSSENYKFVSFINNKILFRFNKRLPDIPNVSLYSITPLFTLLKNKINEKCHYKILKCPNCKQKLRVPRGKKKIIVTCKRCLYEFKAKS